MLVDFLGHLLALDIAWIVALIIDNLFFLFAFLAAIHFFLEGKRVILGFLILTATIWLWSDFSSLVGAVVFTGGFLILHYMGKMAVLTFAEHSVALKKRMILVNEIQGIGTFIVYNILIQIGLGF